MKHLLMLLMLVSSISAFAAVPMQTTQDRAESNRLVIDGKARFISGMNIAWNNFANDVGDQAVSINAFVSQFKQIKNAGGNAVRWWLHTDAQHCPKINSQGQVTGIGSKTIDNIRQVLDSAYNYGIVVSLTLFSFDLLQNDNNKTTAQMDANEKFLTVPANLDTYITNGLRPILDAVGNHPAIMCWEVFNEPEGMTTQHGWSTRKIDHSHVMRFTNKIAGEVHRRTKKMASTGIHNWSSGERARYTTAKLKEAGGDNDGYLDFYMAHYYPEYGGTSESPFHHPASYWGFDKPVLIGEFPAQSWGPGTGYTNIQQGTAMTITAAFEYAYNNGYCGAMSWSITEGNKAKFGDSTTTKPALQNLYSKYKNDIDGIPVSGNQSSSSKASSSSTAVSSSSRPSSSSAATSSSSSIVQSSSSIASSSSSSSSHPSSSSVVSSSSSSSSPSSSSEDITLITNHSPLATSHSPTYYSLKGEPLGNAKPQKAGVYIIKQGSSVKKIVVRQ